MRLIIPCPLVFLSVLLLQSCAKEEPAEIPLPAPIGGAEDPFTGVIGGPLGVRMTFGAQDVLILEAGPVLSYANVNGQTNDPPALSYRYYLAGMYDADAKVAAFAATKGSLYYEAPQVMPDAFATFFAPGPHTYGVATTGLNGVELEFRDAAGQRWSTQCGSTLQPSSEFLISAVVQGFDGIGQKLKVAAAFTSTFYNCDTGAAQLVDDGLLVLDFRDF